MKQTLATHIICFIAGLAFAMGILHLFSDGGTNNSTQGTVHIVNPSVIWKRLAVLEGKYKLQVDSIKKLNTQLQTKINHTQSALRKTRLQNTQLENRVEELIEVNNSATDTTLLLDNCDTLAVVVQDLIVINQNKDSLYDELLHDHVMQIGLRDSIIIIQEQNHQTLKATLDTTLLQQQQLINANKNQQQQLKKQKRGKRLLSSFLIVLAGLTTYSAVK